MIYRYQIIDKAQLDALGEKVAAFHQAQKIRWDRFGHTLGRSTGTPIGTLPVQERLN